MRPLYEAETIQIDITNHCFLSCLYCSRYNRHLTKELRRHMSMEQLHAALSSLKIWPGKIGIIGGEPLLHPQFIQLCQLIQSMFPLSKMGLWTSGGKNMPELLPLIANTFGFVAYNEHNPIQLATCKHQPLTIAIKDAVKDPDLRRELINDCWVQRTWCPTINHFGAYFCEVAAAQDVLLNEGKNAWPVEPGWWKRGVEQFQDQVDALCENCGMAIPMERELIKNTVEKFSPTTLHLFREKKLLRVENKDIELFDSTFSKEEILANIRNWTPGNYRGDLHCDDHAPEGKGFTKDLVKQS